MLFSLGWLDKQIFIVYYLFTMRERGFVPSDEQVVNRHQVEAIRRGEIKVFTLLEERLPKYRSIAKKQHLGIEVVANKQGQAYFEGESQKVVEYPEGLGDSGIGNTIRDGIVPVVKQLRKKEIAIAVKWPDGNHDTLKFYAAIFKEVYSPSLLVKAVRSLKKSVSRASRKATE